MTSFQTRRNDETDEFVIVLDNLVPVAGLTMKRRGSVLSHQNLIENSQGLSGGGGGGGIDPVRLRPKEIYPSSKDRG